MNLALRRGTAVAAAAAVGLLLAACSSSGQASPVSTTGSALSATASTTPDPVTIRFAELSTANDLTLGRASGLVDRSLTSVGATAQWLGPFANPTDAYNLVYAGKADAGSTGASRLIVWASENRPIVAVAVERYDGNSQGITAAPGSGVTALKDLYGKKVAVGPAPGGTGDYIFEKAFDHAGLDATKVQKVYLADTDAASAFATGQIAAWSTYDQFFATAQSTPGTTVLARGDQIGSHNASIHFVSKDLVENHPGAVKALYDGLVAQAAAAKADPAVITRAYAKAGASDAVTKVVAGYDIPTIVPLDATAVADLTALAQDYAKYGFIKAAPDLSASVVDVSSLG